MQLYFDENMFFLLQVRAVFTSKKIDARFGIDHNRADVRATYDNQKCWKKR